MRTRTGLACAVVALAITLSSRTADACWCGYSGTVRDVAITEPMPGSDDCPVAWDPVVVRAWATWLVRLDRVLPAGMRLESFAGEATVTATPGGVPRTVAEISWGEDFEALFAAIARLEADSTRVRVARQQEAKVFTVQVFATRSEARASRVSEQLDRAGEVDRGFFFAGNAPAANPAAHVIRETDARGRLLYKVLVGAFVDLASARASAQALTRQTTLETFVRQL